MNSLLSAISGQFSKSLVLGTFLPAVLFVTIGALLLAPLTPHGYQLLSQLKAVDTQMVLALSFASVVLTGLLYNLNIPLIRLYEGYPWKDSLLGKWKSRRHRDRLVAAQALEPRLKLLRDEMKRRGLGGDEYQEIHRTWVDLGRLLNTEFPAAPSSVLPTRLGNVMRCFETYPRERYRISAIPLYPRLIATVDKDYAAVMDSAKASFDFMLNISALSASLSLSILVTGLWYPLLLARPRLWVIWLLEVAFFGCVAFASYLLMVGRASAWGELVRGAFDLYRWPLLKQLGYRRMPNDLNQERDVWHGISQHILFGDITASPIGEYSEEQTFVRAAPDGVGVSLARGVIRNPETKALDVCIFVKNVDSHYRTARRVIITDTLPTGFDFVWGSAEAGGKPVQVLDIAPYRFQLSNLDHASTITLTYRMIPLKDH
jgi:hypothetical protein